MKKGVGWAPGSDRTFRERKNILLLPVIKSQIVQPTASSLYYAIPIVYSRYVHYQGNWENYIDEMFNLYISTSIIRITHMTLSSYTATFAGIKVQYGLDKPLCLLKYVMGWPFTLPCTYLYQYTATCKALTVNSYGYSCCNFNNGPRKMQDTIRSFNEVWRQCFIISCKHVCAKYSALVLQH